MDDFFVTETNSLHDDKNNCYDHLTRTVGVINLSQFLRHLDSFILTNNFPLICQIRDFGSGQILQPRQFPLSPGLAKIAPWRLARRDNFVAKAPGQVTGRADAANVYSLNRRAVSTNISVCDDYPFAPSLKCFAFTR
jgi:hypothetical protein